MSEWERKRLQKREEEMMVHNYICIARHKINFFVRMCGIGNTDNDDGGGKICPTHVPENVQQWRRKAIV